MTISDSIILVNFTDLRRLQDMPPAEAAIDAGAVPFRPMLLTAAAVVVGASVILSDPAFQGLAISLIATQEEKHGRGTSLPRSWRSAMNQLMLAPSEAADRQLVFQSALSNRNLDMSRFP